MRGIFPSLPPGEPDPFLVHRLIYVQRTGLAVVSLISAAALMVWPLIENGTIPRTYALHISMPIAATMLLCALSLAFSEPGHLPRIIDFSRQCAIFGAAIALLTLLESILRSSVKFDAYLAQDPPGMGPPTLLLVPPAWAIFLALVIILNQKSGRLIRGAADVIVSCLCLLTLILISERVFGAFGLFGLSTEGQTSPLLLFCLMLLALVVTLRQAEYGIFSIFLGRGIGSRIARGFAPLLLLLPFAGAVGNFEIEITNLVPERYAASIIASLAAAFSIALLLLLVWRINGMEKEIHELTLRDELTGLYNMRGFYLLAEQTLRLAQRAKLPFSVLFIDLDNLKQINDKMGHNMGSAYLAETAVLIDETFREGDVKGRFGGDEFVVAGQFSILGMQLAMQRLESAANERSAAAGRRFPLSFSAGAVTCEHYSEETLKEMVRHADEAMYQEKRRRKGLVQR
jgi:diguanylate cyclase (GGDEF)-like protein